jgi:hypothetical protein
VEVTRIDVAPGIQQDLHKVFKARYIHLPSTTVQVHHCMKRSICWGLLCSRWTPGFVQGLDSGIGAVLEQKLNNPRLRPPSS